MKYSQLRRGLSPEDAAAYVGSKELLRQFERAKWLKPFVRGNRLTRFNIRDLDGCIDRLKAGELTPQRVCATYFRLVNYTILLVRREMHPTAESRDRSLLH